MAEPQRKPPIEKREAPKSNHAPFSDEALAALCADDNSNIQDVKRRAQEGWLFYDHRFDIPLPSGDADEYMGRHGTHEEDQAARMVVECLKARGITAAWGHDDDAYNVVIRVRGNEPNGELNDGDKQKVAGVVCEICDAIMTAKAKQVALKQGFCI